MIYKSFGEWISSKGLYKISSWIRVGGITSTSLNQYRMNNVKMIRFTWQVIPSRVAAGQFTHTCAEGQPEEQPAGQPEADRVMITARGVTAQ